MPVCEYILLRLTIAESTRNYISRCDMTLQSQPQMTYCYSFKNSCKTELRSCSEKRNSAQSSTLTVYVYVCVQVEINQNVLNNDSFVSCLLPEIVKKHMNTFLYIFFIIKFILQKQFSYAMLSLLFGSLKVTAKPPTIQPFTYDAHTHFFSRHFSWSSPVHVV